jgi:HTH-type transcriptional regulator / antitoxin HigA
MTSGCQRLIGLISRKRLNEFAERHADTRTALQQRHQLMKANRFGSFSELRTVFPSTESDYQRLVAFLDALIDVVGEEEGHPLAPLMKIVGMLIEKYEDEHVPDLTEA